jgi:FKBP-type peptidyl-prolyl cis-trans isomerase
MKGPVLLLAAALLLSSCQAAPKPADAATPGVPSKTDASYAFGVLLGTQLKSTAVPLDYDALVSGIKDVVEKNTPKVAADKAGETVQAAITDAQKKLGEANAAAETKFLADNGKKAGVKTTASGLQYEVEAEGTGAKPTATDSVKVDYVGKLLDGSTFDSSIDRKAPQVIDLSRVFPGWTEGLQLMTVGSKYKFYIPSALAYGSQGAGGKIPPNSTLVFEVTLLSIEKPAAPAPSIKLPTKP